MNQDQDLPKSLVPYYSLKFSYQAILSSEFEADRTSMSPSPSRSTAYTEIAPLALEVMVWAVNAVPIVLKPLEVVN